LAIAAVAVADFTYSSFACKMASGSGRMVRKLSATACLAAATADTFLAGGGAAVWKSTPSLLSASTAAASDANILLIVHAENILLNARAAESRRPIHVEEV
jgi:hypothetical protein